MKNMLSRKLFLDETTVNDSSSISVFVGFDELMDGYFAEFTLVDDVDKIQIYSFFDTAQEAKEFMRKVRRIRTTLSAFNDELKSIAIKLEEKEQEE